MRKPRSHKKKDHTSEETRFMWFTTMGYIHRRKMKKKKVFHNVKEKKSTMPSEVLLYKSASIYI